MRDPSGRASTERRSGERHRQRSEPEFQSSNLCTPEEFGKNAAPGVNREEFEVRALIATHPDRAHPPSATRSALQPTSSSTCTLITTGGLVRAHSLETTEHLARALRSTACNMVLNHALAFDRFQKFRLADVR